jgi:hypothetical protein
MLAIVRRQSTSEEQAGWEGGTGKFFKLYLWRPPRTRKPAKLKIHYQGLSDGKVRKNRANSMIQACFSSHKFNRHPHTVVRGADRRRNPAA